MLQPLSFITRNKCEKVAIKKTCYLSYEKWALKGSFTTCFSMVQVCVRGSFTKQNVPLMRQEVACDFNAC